jgi:hypothetical protein
MAYTIKAFNERMSKIKARRKEALKNVDDLHVVLQRGNRKTGANCWTVSLLPVIDCKNCKHCKLECYDLWHDLIYPTVIWDRCRNSAIHEKDPERYWKEIDMQLKANYVSELRINVGGDLQGDDFMWVAWLAKENPQCDILFFTKSYEDINEFLDHHRFPKNVHPIMSAWKGLEMVNPHHLPESHVLYPNGETTAPQYGSTYCGGNCSECHYRKTERGCWGLKKGESVIFNAH